MLTIYAKSGAVIPLGREGENNARRIVFDLKPFEEVFGPGVAQLIVRRSGEDVPYPVALELEGSHVAWTVNSADTAIPGRYGEAELRYMVGDTLAKSERWQTTVIDALGTPSETPPEQQQGWLDKVLSAAAKVEESEAVVREVNENPPKVIGDTWWVWSIDESAYVDAYVSAVGPVGPEGPTGPKGDQGIAGPAGEDGYTPQKGVDYWTEADKQEIVDYVVENVPAGSFLPEVSAEENGMVLRVVDGEWAASKGADENTEERLSALEARLEEHINPYVPISVSASGLGTYEKGVVVDHVTVKWNYNRTPQSLTISGPGIDGTKVLAVTNKSYTIPTSLGINCDNTKNFKWTITVTGDKGEVRSATTSPITFQNRVYYGTAADPRESGGSITDSFIKGLQNKPLSAGKVTPINVNAADGQYIWYCLPEWMGECIFMSGANQLIWDKVDFMLNTINDYSELYYVYRSGNEGLGNQKLGVEGVG